MAMELTILGIRKLREEEVKELTGKNVSEIGRSGYFRQFLPDAPYHSKYTCYGEIDDDMKNVAHLLSPVTDAEGDVIYVFWTEVLGYFWKNLSHDDSRIDEILQAASRYAERDQSFRIVPPEVIGQYLSSYPVAGSEGEIVAVLYG